MTQSVVNESGKTVTAQREELIRMFNDTMQGMRACYSHRKLGYILKDIKEARTMKLLVKAVEPDNFELWHWSCVLHLQKEFKHLGVMVGEDIAEDLAPVLDKCLARLEGDLEHVFGLMYKLRLWAVENHGFSPTQNPYVSDPRLYQGFADKIAPVPMIIYKMERPAKIAATAPQAPTGGMGAPAPQAANPAPATAGNTGDTAGLKVGAA